MASVRLLSAKAFSAFALFGCARSSAHPPAAMSVDTPVRGKRAQSDLVPVSPSPKPTDYSRFSRDGRFAYANGFLYDRGSCVPRARVSEETIAALESTPGSGWEATNDTPNGEAVTAAVRSLTVDEMTSCSAGTFDPIGRSIFVMCTRQGAEYQSFDGSWVALGTPRTLPSLCVSSPERSDITESFGEDVRWSRDRNMFTFLERYEGWNFRGRTIHVVDLHAATHEIINDDEAADRQDPPSYDKIKSFDVSSSKDATTVDIGARSSFSVTFDQESKTVFLERDGKKLRLFDDHLWPPDEGAESPWSDVTSMYSFRTSADPCGGDLLPYGAIERNFVVPGLFRSFLRGESFPPRPAPVLDVPSTRAPGDGGANRARSHLPRP